MGLPSNEAVRAAVEDGLGATAISASVAAPSIESGLLSARPVPPATARVSRFEARAAISEPNRRCVARRHRSVTTSASLETAEGIKMNMHAGAPRGEAKPRTRPRGADLISKVTRWHQFLRAMINERSAEPRTKIGSRPQPRGRDRQGRDGGGPARVLDSVFASPARARARITDGA